MNDLGAKLKKLRKEYGLTQKKLAKNLGLAQTTIANYENNTRRPNLTTLTSLAELLNVSTDYLIGNCDNNKSKDGGLDKNSAKIDNLSNLQKIYLDDLLKGNRQKIYNVLKELIERGLTLQELYLSILQPSLVRIGELWEEGKISVGEEHFFSEETDSIITQLRHPIPIAKKSKGRVLLMCINGESHFIGIKMINNLLENDGWETYFLGTNIPTDSILKFIELKNIDLVAISVTMDYHLNSLESLVKTLKNTNISKEIKVLVGGSALTRHLNFWKDIQADGFAANAKEAVDEANKLIQVTEYTN